MINEIMKGIAMKLNATFGDGYKIYQNDVKQGLEEPCFFISLLKPELSPLLQNRWKLQNPFDIHYFPVNGANNADMFSVAADLMDCLEFITLPNGDELHGTSMSSEVVDDVLHFFVNYNMILTKPLAEMDIDMDSLTSSVDLKRSDSNGNSKN